MGRFCPVASLTWPVVRLTVTPYAFGQAEKLAAALGCSHALAQVLVRRGLPEPAAARPVLEAGAANPPAAPGRSGVRQQDTRWRRSAGSGRPPCPCSATSAAAGASPCTATTTSTASAP